MRQARLRLPSDSDKGRSHQTKGGWVCTKSGSATTGPMFWIRGCFDKDATICDGADCSSSWLSRVGKRQDHERGEHEYGGARRAHRHGLCILWAQGRRGQRSSDLRMGTAWDGCVPYRSRRDDGVALIKVGSVCQGCVHFPNRSRKTWPDDHVCLRCWLLLVKVTPDARILPEQACATE